MSASEVLCVCPRPVPEGRPSFKATPMPGFPALLVFEWYCASCDRRLERP